MKYSLVISLIILDGSDSAIDTIADNKNILLCVRDPARNLHHPNVVSVPTQRIPESLFQAIVNKSHACRVDVSSTLMDAEFVDNSETRGHNPVIYVVESLLAQKLGVSEGSYAGHAACLFRAKPVWLERGCVNYPGVSQGDIETEPIEMLSILVLTADAGRFPRRTHAYSHILWTPIPKFLSSFEHKNVQYAHPDLDPIEFCIHGLCVSSAYKFLKGMRSRMHAAL
ncbi:MAG: hypothetical protein HY922_11020 [Elusimicrobia bacterium]|nr:hypothetical protein [Elusimicrobiota bacterium]